MNIYGDLKALPVQQPGVTLSLRCMKQTAKDLLFRMRMTKYDNMMCSGIVAMRNLLNFVVEYQEQVMLFITRVLIDLKALQPAFALSCSCRVTSLWGSLSDRCTFHFRYIILPIFQQSPAILPCQGSVMDERELRSFAARSFREGKPRLTMAELRQGHHGIA